MTMRFEYVHAADAAVEYGKDEEGDPALFIAGFGNSDGVAIVGTPDELLDLTSRMRQEFTPESDNQESNRLDVVKLPGKKTHFVHRYETESRYICNLHLVSPEARSVTGEIVTCSVCWDVFGRHWVRFPVRLEKCKAALEQMTRK
jgi:hypothetical protein